MLNLKDSYQDDMRNYIPSDLQEKIIITNVWHILVMEQIWRKKGRKGSRRKKVK